MRMYVNGIVKVQGCEIGPARAPAFQHGARDGASQCVLLSCAPRDKAGLYA